MTDDTLARFREELFEKILEWHAEEFDTESMAQGSRHRARCERLVIVKLMPLMERYGDQRELEGWREGLNHYSYTSSEQYPCDDCGSISWTDWVLFPHEVFNSVCPGGNGMLCFPCFIKRAAQLDKAKPKQDEPRHGFQIKKGV
jgi:hypothetical protein